MNKPASVRSREERFARRKSLNMHILHVTVVDKTGEKHDDQRSAIILDKLPHVSLEEATVTEFVADPSAHKHEKRHHDAKECGSLASKTPLSGQDLDAFLEIDKCDVESKNIAWETCHVF